MKVLVVASDKGNHFAPFIEEQMQALQLVGVEIVRFGIKGKGVMGYLKSLPLLKATIRREQPDIIHAHYGLSGLLANMQRHVPVVTTYHGSDINVKKVLYLSRMAMRLSAWNIFVSQRNVDIAKPKRQFTLIPCGVNLEDFPLMDKVDARKQLQLDENKKYVLFAGAFDNKVKAPTLAKATMTLLPEVELLELKGYSRQQVAMLFNAVDCLLMTSLSEGSPQVIKEAMACGCPIVSVDVGDVATLLRGVRHCYIADRRVQDILQKLQDALSFQGRTEGRKQVVGLGLTNDVVANRIISICSELV